MLTVTKQAAKANGVVSCFVQLGPSAVRRCSIDWDDLEEVKVTAVTVSAIFHDLVDEAYPDNGLSPTARSTPPTAWRFAGLARCLGDDQRPDTAHLNDRAT